MTTKEAQFAENYVLNGKNAKQAAIDAGYSEALAVNMSAALLKRADIKAFIAEMEGPFVTDPDGAWRA